MRVLLLSLATSEPRDDPLISTSGGEAFAILGEGETVDEAGVRVQAFLERGGS